MTSSSVENTESFLDILRAGVGDDHKPELVAHLFVLPSDRSQSASPNLIEEARLFFQQHSTGYVWHTGHPPAIEAPSPSTGTSASAEPLLTLRLETPVATPDNDEWFSLHLLIRFATSLSTQDGRQRYAIQTTDSDGDFLLIQGADELPDWIEPSNAPNRVWLLPSLGTQQPSASANSTIYPLASLHLIGPDFAVLPPEDESSGNSGQHLSVAEALQILSQDSDGCRSSQALQSAALGPMVEFATPTADGGFVSAHTTLAYLPSGDVAALLQIHPQLGAQALGALEGLSADQIDRRVLARMERFGHLFESDRDLVLAPVSLTKALYALALHLVFFPPKPHFPQAWRDSVASFRGAAHDQQAGPSVDPTGASSQSRITEINEESERERHEAEQKQTRSIAEGRWRDIGAKLVCGLELLYARGRARSRAPKARRGADGTNNRTGPVLEDLYLLENVPDLIDAFVPLPASQSGFQRSRPGLRQSERSSTNTVDQSSDLESLLARESSTEWLSEMLNSGAETSAQEEAEEADGRDGSADPNEENEAFNRLQRLVQGTTDFLNDEQADYRGAIFDDDNMDESDADEEQPEAANDADELESRLEPQQRDPDAQSDISSDSNDAELEAGRHPGITDEAEEMASFLSFARNELGIDDELWEKIQADRRKDGRYVPPPLSGSVQAGSSNKGSRSLEEDTDVLSAGVQGNRPPGAKKVRFDGFAKGFLNKKSSNGKASSSRGQTRTPFAEPSSHQKKRSSLWDVPDGDDNDDDENDDTEMRSADGRSASGSNVQDDDGFYEMLDRMDAELARAQRQKAQQSAPQSARAAGKQRDTSGASGANEQRAEVEDDDGSEGDSDEELDLQDAELLRKLVSAQGEALLGRRAGQGAQAGESQLDDLNAGMLANLLESIKAQGGAAGPVSNLAGRLGIGRLPRDDDA
ncbi:hypothetical protein OC861_000600 [Tilletia horrida]|nr:hypothetical protein OC861_000600 [Tilletia horrida]